MSFRVREDFKPKEPVSAVPSSWFNAVAHFLNNLVGGFGIKIFRDRDPPQICLDKDTVVTTSDDQTITGNKVFANTYLKVSTSDTTASNYHQLLAFNDANGNTAAELQATSDGKLRLLAHDNSTTPATTRVFDLNGDGTNVWTLSSGAGANCVQLKFGAVEIYGATPYIDFHFGNSSADFTSRIAENTSGALTLNAPNHVYLSVAPSSDTSTSSTEVATVGLLNSKFANGVSPASPFSVITNVWWDDTNKKLMKEVNSFAIVNGVITSIGTAQQAVIDQAVTYN